jgi:hypothetical protein
MEEWRSVFPLLHYSTTPLLHHSTTPPLHHSTLLTKSDPLRQNLGHDDAQEHRQRIHRRLSHGGGITAGHAGGKGKGRGIGHASGAQAAHRHMVHAMHATGVVWYSV